MQLGILTPVFIVTSGILTLLIIIQKLFSKKLKNTYFAAIIAVFLFFYIIEAFFAVIFLNNYFYEFIMLLFAISPFLIGKAVSYKTETFFSILQIISIIISAVFVYYISGVKV